MARPTYLLAVKLSFPLYIEMPMYKYNSSKNVDVAEVCCVLFRSSLSSVRFFLLKVVPRSFPTAERDHTLSRPHVCLCVSVCVFVKILLQRSRFSLSLCVEVKGQSNSFLYCNLDQY